MNSEFLQTLKSDKQAVEAALSSIFDTNHPLEQAMHYAVLNGGKRLRAHLVLETARIFSVQNDIAMAGAMAVELIHAYSLVHDDLPSMDNDDLRRGLPTVHKKWNEWTAILVGDGLQSRAFAILSEKAPSQVFSLSQAAENMVHGQYWDMSYEQEKPAQSLENIEKMHRKKTGALIEWSACFGASIAQADPAPFRQYAQNIGLAFQIWDDILDVEGEAQALGKTLGKDQQAGKMNYVSELGLEGAKHRAQSLIIESQKNLLDTQDSFQLKALAQYMISRDY